MLNFNQGSFSRMREVIMSHAPVANEGESGTIVSNCPRHHARLRDACTPNRNHCPRKTPPAIPGPSERPASPKSASPLIGARKNAHLKSISGKRHPSHRQVISRLYRSPRPSASFLVRGDGGRNSPLAFQLKYYSETGISINVTLFADASPS